MVRSFIFASALLVATASSGMELSPDGSGQVLLFPYYTASDGQDTLVTIGSLGEHAQIVKVRFLEGYNSRPVLDFDLYLPANEIWVGAVTKAADGRAMLRTPASTCTVPALPTAGAVFSTAQFDGSGGLPADAGPRGVERTREGFIEVISGGTIASETSTYSAIVGLERTCTPLPGSLFEDIDGPGETIYGTAAVISVGLGLYYAYDATALDGFSPDPLYSPAMGPLDPSLANAGGHLAGADASIPGYGLVHFDRKIDAVSAVLAKSILYNQYVAPSALGARSDWVVSMPTQRYYTDPAISGSTTALPPFDEVFHAPGVAPLKFVDPTIYDRLGNPCQGDYCQYETEFHLDRAVNVIAYATPQQAEAGASGVFASRLATYLYPYQESGHTRLQPRYFRAMEGVDLSPSQQGHVCVSGVPAVGFLAYNLVNANAQPGRLANYGGIYRDQWYGAGVSPRDGQWIHGCNPNE
ncbi:MAG: hypothetical protein ACTHK2_06045 [Dokdonella sp.]|uniref:hypothetical protein n=1 Tax=Dokdonella sp. TaxID=2291710 RepID=UPI003F7F7CB5